MVTQLYQRPDTGEAALAAEQASRPGAPVRFLRAVVPDEQTCFCLYQAPPAGAVRQAMTHARPRPERITRAATVRPPRTRPGPAPRTQATTRPPAPSPDPPGPSSRPPQFPAAARAAALFASGLPCRCPPGGAAVEAAISSALAACGGADGCVGVLAAAYGDHPETAVPRMRWARQAIEAMRSAGRPLSTSGTRPS